MTKLKSFNTWFIIGNAAGSNTQGAASVAIGDSAGAINQGTGAVAIGNAAGYPGQGYAAISIGHLAGFSAVQADHSILIEATSGSFSNTVPNSCVINPIRNLNGPASQRLYYSPAGAPGQVGEITWGTDESSIRYKHNVIDLPSRYVDAIYRLKPVEFEFKSVPDQRRVGLIAEEVAEHMPELVVYNALDQSIIEGLEYEHLVAPLISIVQDFKSRIDILETANRNYETMLKTYETRLKTLETKF